MANKPLMFAGAVKRIIQGQSFFLSDASGTTTVHTTRPQVLLAAGVGGGGCQCEEPGPLNVSRSIFVFTANAVFPCWRCTYICSFLKLKATA